MHQPHPGGMAASSRCPIILYSRHLPAFPAWVCAEKKEAVDKAVEYINMVIWTERETKLASPRDGPDGGERGWDRLPTRHPFHAFQQDPVGRKSNCSHLVLFLANQHEKRDVSVIFTISRETAKFPAGPGVGADMLGVCTCYFPINILLFGATIPPACWKILSVYIIMCEVYFFVCSKKNFF